MKQITVKSTGYNIVLDTYMIQQALNKAKLGPIHIYIPKGTYYIGKELVIYNDTTLTLHEEAVLKRMSPGCLIKNGKKPGYSGYDGNSNIIIQGGTLDNHGNVLNLNNTIMCIGHARNIVIKDVTFKNVVGGHAIDACGLDGVEIANCKFLGFRDDKGERSFSEAIQIDLQIESAFPKFGLYDGTPTKNVWIHHCYFGNSNDRHMKPWNRAIGSHASRYNIFYENVFIEHNTFEGMQDFALTPLKTKTLRITNNEFINCAGGIRYYAVNSGNYSIDMDGVDGGIQAGELTLIDSNNFVSLGDKYAIYVRSYENVRNKDIVITNNSFVDDGSSKVKIDCAEGVYCTKNDHLKHVKMVNVHQIYEDIE